MGLLHPLAREPEGGHHRLRVPPSCQHPPTRQQVGTLALVALLIVSQAAPRFLQIGSRLIERQREPFQLLLDLPGLIPEPGWRFLPALVQGQTFAAMQEEERPLLPREPVQADLLGQGPCALRTRRQQHRPLLGERKELLDQTESFTLSRISNQPGWVRNQPSTAWMTRPGSCSSGISLGKS